jgi:hypothetical protein
MPIHRGALLRALAVAGALSTCSAFAVNAGVAEACHADAASVCPGMEPGDGNFARCMKEHHDKLSEGCRTAIKKARTHGKHEGQAASGGTHRGAGGEGPDD